jgi:Matrixin
MLRIRQNLIGALCLLVMAGHASAIDIVFDYSLDTNNFFDTQTKRDVLDEAAAVFEVFTDSLDAISPGTVYNPGTANEFTDTWDATFTHPGTGDDNYTLTDLTIAADTILVFVGGRDLTGLTLGIGGPGGYDAFGLQSFVDSVEGRGQAGALAQHPAIPYDFGPWGGAITFDTPNDWHFGTQTLPGSNESDFFSVAVHELGHLLGFGTATSFDALASGTTFSGTEATALFSSNPPLHFDQYHWQTGTTSAVPGGGPQETAMDPDIADGQVKQFTLLDFAALKDVGWEVPPMTGGGIEGDLNYDGFVGINDLNLVLSFWNQSVAPGDPLLGDPTGDGFVGIEDLNLVLSNWNDGTPPTLAVPEPTTLLLLLGPAGLMLSRRG